MKALTSFLFLVALALLAACSQSSPDTLTGTYYIDERAKGEVEFLRIEKLGDSYGISQKHGDKWSPATPVKPMAKEAFERFIKKPVDFEFSGLSNQSIAIFRVPKGWKDGRFESKTGYWAMTIFGPVELIKR